MPKDPLAIHAEQRILILRKQKVMLDFHLAELCGVETRPRTEVAWKFPRSPCLVSELFSTPGWS